jgi:biotin carboxyl carrier protein
VLALICDGIWATEHLDSCVTWLSWPFWGVFMNYRLKIGEEIVSLEAGRPDDSGSCLMAMGENQRTAAVKAVSADRMHAQVDGTLVSFSVVRTDDGAWVWCNGRARLVQDASALERRKSRGPVGNPGQVTPPTPASVVRVLVEQGDEVTKGQALVVVSAMKMEMTLAAPYDGTVTAVNTQVGAQVSPGEILVEIEPKAQEQAHESA